MTDEQRGQRGWIGSVSRSKSSGRGARTPWLAVTLLWVAACTARIGSGNESPTPDARVGDDASVAVDAAPAADALPDATPLLSCDEAYGTAPGYTLCPVLTTENTCAFSVDTDQEPCEVVCPRFGGTCVRAYDNPAPPEQCTVIEPNLDNCQTLRVTEICECTRVPVGAGS